MVFDDLLDVLDPDWPDSLVAADPEAEADADPDADADAESVSAEPSVVPLAAADVAAAVSLAVEDGLSFCLRITGAAFKFSPIGHGQAADRPAKASRSTSMLFIRPSAFIFVQAALRLQGSRWEGSDQVIDRG